MSLFQILIFKNALRRSKEKAISDTLILPRHPSHTHASLPSLGKNKIKKKWTLFKENRMARSWSGMPLIPTVAGAEEVLTPTPVEFKIGDKCEVGWKTEHDTRDVQCVHDLQTKYLSYRKGDAVTVFSAVSRHIRLYIPWLRHGRWVAGCCHVTA